MNRGIVYLVGAGPGDPTLISVKGRRCVRQADVVLHDRLIHPDLLTEARRNAILIDVGKRRGREDERQTEIHELMISYARQDKVVCRLKGGDPFVFGRGGEEVEALREAGIPYEVVPGISSIMAGPAAAGIPLTHRDHTHGFLVLTGSRSVNYAAAEWEAARTLLKAGGTVIIVMGSERVRDITAHLAGAGVPTTTPAAAIVRATWPEQEVRFGTLGAIGEDPVGPSPALLVFGNVVEFAHSIGSSGGHSH